MLMLLLFLTGLLAGTVDAIAGGGGLISIPLLLSMGLSPQLAFGTNKMQSTIGTLNAVYKFYRKGYINLKPALRGVVFSLIGGLLGSFASQLIHADFLKKIIPILLAVVLLYTIFTPKLGYVDQKPRMREALFFPIFGLLLGFYDGFFGPGVGSFWVIVLTGGLGYNLIKATAETKLFNLSSNIIAFICFAIGGYIDYRIGFCMAAGQLIGGQLGAALAMTKGARFIRPVFLTVVSLTTISLVYKNYNLAVIMQSLQNHYTAYFLWSSMIILLAIGFYFKNKKRKTIILE